MTKIVCILTCIIIASNILQDTNELPYNQAIQDLRSISPKITLLSRLQSLHLPNNFITGAIPENISSLTLLRELDVYGNELHGSLPEGIFDIPGLEILSMGRNSFSGSISTKIGMLYNLKSLHLGYNMMLTGKVPDTIANLDILGM